MEASQLWKQRYQQALKQNQQLQIEKAEISQKLAQAISLNKSDRQQILKLEQKIADLQDQAKTLVNNAGVDTTLFRTGFALQHSMNSLRREMTGRGLTLIRPENHQMFECFFIIGKAKQEQNVKILEKFPLAYKQDTNVICSFAFPKTLKAQSIVASDSGTSVYSLLYRQYYRDQRSYIFTIKSSTEQTKIDVPEIANKERELLYGCCLLIDDVGGNTQQSLLINKKCICILTYLPCFELHFSILYRIMEIRRFQRVSDLSELESANRISIFSPFSRASSLSEVDSASVELNNEQIQLIQEYYTSKFLRPGASINLELENAQPIQCTIPSDLKHLDSLWCCGLLFSLITLDDFFQLLSAIMCEQSVVFISSNLNYLSSCVLGFQCLMRPFRWPHLISPVLPDQYIGLIEAPIPLIVGITNNPPYNPNYANIAWVRLDTQNIKKRLAMLGGKVVQPYANDLKEYLKISYKKFSGQVCYDPDQEQKDAIQRITNDIQKYWMQIIEKIPPKLNDPDSQGYIDIEEIKEKVLQRIHRDDLRFVENLLTTQMFTNIIEEIYEII